jgi:hypothetical protein
MGFAVRSSDPFDVSIAMDPGQFLMDSMTGLDQFEFPLHVSLVKHTVNDFQAFRTLHMGEVGKMFFVEVVPDHASP